MRIKKVFFAFVIATAFTACSGDETIIQQEGNAVVIPDDAEIIQPIRLGAGSDVSQAYVSRSAIDPDASGNLPTSGTDDIGLYMLAIYNQGIRPSSAINWTTTKNEHNWLFNQRTKPISDAGKTLLQFYDGDDSFIDYYPLVSKYAYRFFGYHPYQQISNVHVTDNKITVDFTGLDGTKDILWGMSDVGTDKNITKPASTSSDQKKLWKYSARYFRISDGSTVEDYPIVAFHHMLMAFQFKLQAQGNPKDGLTENEKYAECEKMTLKSVTIKNVASEMTLTIADYSDDHYKDPNPASSDDWFKGEIVAKSSNLVDYVLKDDDDADFTPTQVLRNLDGEGNPQAYDVGQKMLLPVLASGDYEAIFTFIYDDGTPEGKEFSTASTIEISKESSFNYEAGKYYNVILQVAGPQQINVRAILDEWKDAAEDGADLRIIDFN